MFLILGISNLVSCVKAWRLFDKRFNGEAGVRLGREPGRPRGGDLRTIGASCKVGTPNGLIAFAAIQFVFCLGLLGSIGGSSAYSTLSPLITAVLMGVSAVGYLRRDYMLGFCGGNVLGVGTILNILAFNAAQGFENFGAHVPSLSYPIVLLFFLNDRYKNVFVK